MSHSEISIVIRQSLQQLQTKNPMDDDFYYQVYTSRQGGPWKGVGLPGIEVSGPLMVNRFRNADGTPILPEGTLGRVAFSTIRKPRTLLQLTGSRHQVEDGLSPVAESGTVGGPRRFMFARLSLMYVIEEGIRFIMDVEDVDNLLLSFPSTSPEEAANQAMLHLQRVKLGKRLLEHLGINEILDENGVPVMKQSPLSPPDPNHIVFKYGSLVKGRNLVLRSLMCLAPEQVFLLVHIMMAQLSLFAVPSSPEQFDFQTGPVLEKHFNQWAHPQIIQLAFGFVSSSDNVEKFVDILRSPVGCSFILCFCKRGHELRSHPLTPPGDVAAWIQVYRRIWGLIVLRFDELLPVETPELSASLLNRWRMIADLSSHAFAAELTMIPRTGRLWQLVDEHISTCPPVAYFANLVASVYRDQPQSPTSI
uniref:Uncharacterized protein n=1 Tax=Spongospora subterranea TaxID=70186 RepID=A0A0H5QJQ5_9EUKA|eukprot:CRZ01556.1 hypothetical protein [Spongospora subterranea]